MASEEHPPVYNDDDLDDDDDDSEPLNADDAVAGDSESSSETDDGDANSTAAVTVAIPASVAAPTASVTVALPDPKPPPPSLPPPEKKPIDDSRRLFQRLWTDEDEIELLQGFLEYTSSRGTSGHHHDTTAFYDQIKSKLQLDFNKNQLVEKLRRLKKKYRNVLGKMTSGKEFVFKSPHDQATFEISRKIWSNTPVNHRGTVELDDDDQNPNHNPNHNSVVSATPPNNSYAISHINLNNSATPDHRAGNTGVSFDVMGSNLSAHAIAGSKLSSRKRPRVGKLDDRFVRVNLGGSGSSEGGNVHSNNNNNNNNSNNNSSNIGVGTAMQGLIEETVKNCLVPVFKDLMNNAVNGAAHGSGSAIKGVGALAMNAIPLNFSGVNMVSNGEGMNEKWRKQQILELEVYSKRLELVQDQIKSTLEELRSMGT